MDNDYIWLYEAAIGAFFLLIILPCLRKIAEFITNKKFLHLGKRTVLPIQVMCVIAGVYFLAHSIHTRFFSQYDALQLAMYRNVLWTFCIAWFLIRWKNDLHDTTHLSRLHVNAESLRLLSRFATLAIIIVAAMLMLQTLGMDITPLITFGGIGAATLGFASKDVFANFFGGVMLSLCRPLSVGDFVYLPEKNIEGHVEEIGWYLTKIRDREKRTIYLPNSAFATIQVINSTRRSHRRVVETLHIDPRELARMPAIVDMIKEVLQGHAKVDHEQLVLVHFKEFETYSLGLHVEFYLTTLSLDKFFAAKEQILIAIGLKLKENHVEMALPTSVNLARS